MPFRRTDPCVCWRLGYQAIKPSPYHAGPATPQPRHLGLTVAFLAGDGPVHLSDPGKAIGPKNLLRVPPGCAGNTTERLAAHFPWISTTRFAFASSASERSSLRVSSAISCVAAVDRLAPARLAELLQRAILALLAPVRQMRRVQPLTAQQLADLTRPGARVRLGQDLQLVLRRERPPLGLLDQLRVRHPRRRGAPAGHESQLAYGSLVFAAGGSLIRAPAPFVLVSNISGVLRSRPQGHRFLDGERLAGR